MKSSITFCVFITLCLVLSACGDKKETTGLPTPVPQTNPDGSQDLPDPGAVDPDDRIPDLTGAINFTTIENSGLEDLFGGLFLPLVGEPRIRLDLTRQRGGNNYPTGNFLTGKILIAMEDQEGFVAAELSSYGFTGRTNSDGDVMNIIFQDSAIMIGVFGSIDNDKIDASVYYREDRVNVSLGGSYYFSGSIPVCTKWTYTCPSSPYHYANCMAEAQNIKVNLDNKCLNHLNPANSSNVKLLGTFEGTYSDLF